ncbi:MAG: DUF1800 domain-containing protein [Chloroflexota bacterium]
MVTAIREGQAAAPEGGAGPPAQALEGVELMAHLLRRAGFGATPEDLKRYLALGYEAAVEELLHPELVEESPALAEDLLYRYFPDMAAESRAPAPYLVYRMINTRRPLQEKMALFWHGLFATARSKVRIWTMASQYKMLRAHALDRFDAILLALSKDPAMIIWLDNKDSTKDNLNENYGRELLELFAMGIGNYSEDDVKASARAFTGWTIKPLYPAQPFGYFDAEFVYDDTIHDHGEKTVLGQTGPWNGEDIIRILVQHPATARFVATRLHAYFVADEPDAAEIQYLADVFARSGGDLRHVLRALFLSPFFRSEKALFARIKTPPELVAGTVRLTGEHRFPEPGVQRLAAATNYMGQELLNPPSVKGWDGGLAWINTGLLMERVNFAAQELGDPTKPGAQQLVRALTEGGASCPPEVAVDRALAFMGPLRAAPATRQVLVDHVRRDGDLRFATEVDRQTAAERIAELLQLIAASREYQFA